MWVGKDKPDKTQLGMSLQVRREVVRVALLGLKQYNALYANIDIDHELLNQWPEQFIPAAIVHPMVLVDDVEGDAAERGCYNNDIISEL